MNQLSLDYQAQDLVIIGAPCNQFGHQENSNGEEILNSLKYVRPGNGFVPRFTLLAKDDVNGYKAQPLFRFLRHALPHALDCNLEEEVGCDAPKDPTWNVLWSPLSTTDVKWNFEKFLIDRRGVPRFRFCPSTATKDLKPWIDQLLKEDK